MKGRFLISTAQSREPRTTVRQSGRYIKSVINSHTIAFEEGRVICLNESTNGLLLQTNRRFKRGDILEARFPSSANKPIILEVRWTALPGGGSAQRHYQVGCRRLFSS